MRTSQGPFPIETTYEWEPSGLDATRMLLPNRGEQHGFAAVTAPVLIAAIDAPTRERDDAAGGTTGVIIHDRSGVGRDS